MLHVFGLVLVLFGGLHVFGLVHVIDHRPRVSSHS
jgi:hypothetical protein